LNLGKSGFFEFFKQDQFFIQGEDARFRLQSVPQGAVLNQDSVFFFG
jgi:hypothetical protein